MQNDNQINEFMRTRCIVAIASALIMATGVAGCTSGSKTNETPQEDTLTVADKAHELYMTVAEYEAMAPEMREARKNSVILSEYVKRDGMRYFLDITEEKAGELGVNPEGFRECVAQIEAANKMIAEQIEAGDTVEMVDVYGEFLKMKERFPQSIVVREFLYDLYGKYVFGGGNLDEIKECVAPEVLELLIKEAQAGARDGSKVNLILEEDGQEDWYLVSFTDGGKDGLHRFKGTVKDGKPYIEEME